MTDMITAMNRIPETSHQNRDYKFALDIGTRTVIGILTSKKGKNLVVEDYEIVEHPDRAMFDGQVHDILEVSEVVKEIKEALETRNKIKLDSVSIAAAGRALRTETVVLEKKLNISDEIDQELLDSLEMEAIQIAGDKIKNSVPILNTLYYCVGYSTIGIVLDGISIRNPLGHSASTIKFSLVATFLPHNVSDTLHKVVLNAGLNIETMTLEPIAAIEVSVPANLRLLNLGIVDIGAGTSDIALTKDGNIFSYGMVDVAGDEISESLMRTYLLDFTEAEELKLNLIKNDLQKFVDIVGIEHQIQTDEIIETISDTLDEIAQKIADSVLDINKQVPDAVFLVGGSSQMPTLKDRIARALKIDDSRINQKSSDKLSGVEFKTEVLTSPEFVTPIGIGYMSHFVKQKEFISILINSKIYRLFSRNNLSISDALVLAGFNAKRLIQTRGRSINFTLNGEKKVLHGGAGEPSKILLNAKQVTIHTPIKHMDMIEITKPSMGSDADYSLEEVLDYNAYILKGKEKTPLIKWVLVNGKEEDRSYRIKENDVIEVHKNNEEDFKPFNPGEKSPPFHRTDFNENDSLFEEDPMEEDDERNLEEENDYLQGDEEDDFPHYDPSVEEEYEPVIKDSLSEESDLHQDQNVLNLTVNQRPLQIKVTKKHYYLDDLLILLNYSPDLFEARFSTIINGFEVEDNCRINDGDVIDFNFK